MGTLAIPDALSYELRLKIRMDRALMNHETDELKQVLDDAIHDFVGLEPKVKEWDRWILYFLQGLELQAASLDPDHPKEFEAMAARLRDEMDDRLRLDEW